MNVFIQRVDNDCLQILTAAVLNICLFQLSGKIKVIQQGKLQFLKALEAILFADTDNRSR